MTFSKQEKYARYQDRFRLQMTRSAPPARNTPNPHNNQTSSPRARKARAKSATQQHGLSISLGDIYQSAERERLIYSSACRRQNLEHAQSQTQFFRSDTAGSRPMTSVSRQTDITRQDVTTPISAWSEQLPSRPNSILPNPELEDLVEDDNDDEEYKDCDLDMYHHTPFDVNMSAVGRDCCEIIGQQMCYECRKNRIRQIHKNRSDMMFPTLEPSEDNLTTASIVKKYLPGLSYPEIEIKIARGEIARPGIRHQHNKTVEFSDEEDEVKPKVTNKKVTLVEHKKTVPASKYKTNELFFTNVRDLNYKIITGTVDRNIGFVKRQSSPSLNLVKKDLTPFKSHYPSFVSPRKVQLVAETKYKTFFAPPLIEKAKQDVEPAFFAGSTGEYVLPEKLPDELVFVDKDGNEVKASDSEGFTAKASASDEAGNKSKESVTDNTAGKQTLQKDLSALKEDEEEEDEDSDKLLSDKTNSDKESSDKSKSPIDSVSEANKATPEVVKPRISTVKARTVNKT